MIYLDILKTHIELWKIHLYERIAKRFLTFPSQAPGELELVHTKVLEVAVVDVPRSPTRRRVARACKARRRERRRPRCRQHMTKCGNTCALKAKHCKMCGICDPSAKTSFVPTPSGSR